MTPASKRTLVAAAVLAACAMPAAAQIKMATQPYVKPPELSFEIDVPKPVAVVVPVIPVEVWFIRSGSYLRETLQEWATRAGWSLVWEIPPTEDFRMGSGARFEGDFKTVVKNLFDSMPPKIRIHAELRLDNTPPLILVARDEGKN